LLQPDDSTRFPASIKPGRTIVAAAKFGVMADPLWPFALIRSHRRNAGAGAALGGLASGTEVAFMLWRAGIDPFGR
jgi:hypothetical protein